MKQLESVLLWVFAGLAFCNNGCNCPSSATGPALSAEDNLFPEEWKHPEATLTIGGVSLDTKIELEADGAKRIIKIRKDDTVIEEEVYEADSRGIRLVRIGPSAGDRFEPPMELIKLPSRVGDTIEWRGRVFSGSPKGVPSEAVIVSRAETVSLATGPAQAVHVTAELKLKDGSEKPATRHLQFWFVRGEGPVKRDFGTVQIREPRTVGSKGEGSLSKAKNSE